MLDSAGDPIEGQAVTATDKKTGAMFNATSGGNGIYACLLPPETAYEISTSSDGLSARGGNTYGQVVEGSPVKVNGRNLYAAGGRALSPPAFSSFSLWALYG